MWLLARVAGVKSTVQVAPRWTVGCALSGRETGGRGAQGTVHGFPGWASARATLIGGWGCVIGATGDGRVLAG